MISNLDTLTAQALSLPADERFELAQRIWLSVEQEMGGNDALFTEIARRDEELDAGVAQTFSHDEVMRDARKTLGE
jgi:putative addiction module component (TIGR02574 family)